jgi:D-xylose 1-dehydrogenase (NADP+, D-xylono-1,5-lactone-forming)
MSPHTLRWGVLGTGRITRALIAALRASPRNEVVAAASRTPARAEAFAREWSLPRAFAGYQAMLEDPHIDVVYNALPNHLHAQWTIAAARHGKHVLCEKPLALAVDDVDHMAEAARAARVVVAEAFMYRHHPQTLKVKELVDGGAVGALRLVRGAFSFTLTRAEDVRLDPACGGGSLWDVGCYPVSYARLLAGEEPVEAFGWQTLGPTGVDEAFAGQLRFGGGMVAQVDCSFRLPFRTHVEVVGRDGVITIPRPYKPGTKETVVLTRGDSVESIEVEGPELYLGEVEDMFDAVRLGRPSRVSLAESRGNVAALVALLRSAREGRPVALDA